jgi:hypothetical protein
MRSAKPGTSISDIEVVNISEHGFWLSSGGKECFLDYARFPWFKNATVSQICNIELSHGTHLYWPDLDVDLSFDIIENPDRYKRVSR